MQPYQKSTKPIRLLGSKEGKRQHDLDSVPTAQKRDLIASVEPETTAQSVLKNQTRAPRPPHAELQLPHPYDDRPIGRGTRS